MWVSFTERKPRSGDYEEGNYLITRFQGMGGGDCFEDWKRWNNKNLQIINPDGSGKISHWWDGPSDMKLAIEEWNSSNLSLHDI